jgi:hypothetical protein
MASSLVSGLFGTTAPASVRRPVSEVAFGSTAAADWVRSLVSIRAEWGVAPFVDAASVRVSGMDPAPSIALGDTAAVSLGYDDDKLYPILSGDVQSLRRTIAGEIDVGAAGGSAKLAVLRINQSYEQVSAGDIVRDLCGRAGASTGTIDDGADLPFYVIDDRSTAWRHIYALALKSGYTAALTGDGELKFSPAAAGDPVQTFAFGIDILDFRATEAAALIGTTVVTGEGAAGKEGSDAWNWLTKDSSGISGSTGSDSPERVFVDASLRSADAVQSASEASSARSELARHPARLLVAGAPAVIPGSAIEIVSAPQEAMNGLYAVRWIRHSFSKSQGFTTLIECAKTANGSLSGIFGGL